MFCFSVISVIFGYLDIITMLSLTNSAQIIFRRINMYLRYKIPDKNVNEIKEIEEVLVFCKFSVIIIFVIIFTFLLIVFCKYKERLKSNISSNRYGIHFVNDNDNDNENDRLEDINNN